MQPFEIGKHPTRPADELRQAVIHPDDTALAHCRVWLDWAVTQINRSLANDTAACERLLAALDAMMQAASGGLPETSPADAWIAQKMSEVVVEVQSHDRLMQQLTHVGESLRGLHEHLADPHNAASPDAWRVLGEQQLRAFSMTEERALFAAIVGMSNHHDKDSHLTNPAANIDLFDEPHGTDEPS